MQTAVLPQAATFAAAGDAIDALDEPAEWQGFSAPVSGRPGMWESMAWPAAG